MCPWVAELGIWLLPLNNSKFIFFPIFKEKSGKRRKEPILHLRQTNKKKEKQILNIPYYFLPAKLILDQTYRHATGQNLLF